MKKGKLTVKMLNRILVDPFYCINFNESHFGEHQPMVTKEEWIKCQIIKIEGSKVEKGMGLEKYFKLLLDVLENGQ